ncbi:dual specificity protein phosphatase [Anaeramoeba flamelloides]|uniref:protein-tyrosine-phosphatase n=1 Tax=Anaeramoeba flamelloides TaxID=1746091 RepID=A0AAV7YFV0_9EUKA|nr:dual specificity protein phosphatase [Anaeramoeba flamelloides]
MTNNRKLITQEEVQLKMFDLKPTTTVVRSRCPIKFERPPNKILDGLYLGSFEVASSLHELEKVNITHTLNMHHEKVEYPDIITKNLPIWDDPEWDLLSVLEECFDFIDKAIKSDGNVLVHCYAGISRSAAVVIGYLMKTKKMSYDDAYLFVKKKRPVAFPNEGFVKQLKSLEKN